jgi:vancomycin permeability regulator SanA
MQFANTKLLKYPLVVSFLFCYFSVVISALDARLCRCIIVCIARIAILDAAINLSTSRRHYDSCRSSNAKKMGGVVDLGASAICESVFFWHPRA